MAVADDLTVFVKEAVGGPCIFIAIGVGNGNDMEVEGLEKIAL